MNKYEEIYQFAADLAEGKVAEITIPGQELSIEHYLPWIGTEYTRIEFDDIKDGITSLEGWDTTILLNMLQHIDDEQMMRRIEKNTSVIFSLQTYDDMGFLRTYTQASAFTHFDDLDIRVIEKFRDDGEKFVKCKPTENDISVILIKAIKK